MCRVIATPLSLVQHVLCGTEFGDNTFTSTTESSATTGDTIGITHARAPGADDRSQIHEEWLPRAMMQAKRTWHDVCFAKKDEYEELQSVQYSTRLR